MSGARVPIAWIASPAQLRTWFEFRGELFNSSEVEVIARLHPRAPTDGPPHPTRINAMKITNILLLSVSVAALAACGKSQPDTANPADATPPAEEAAAEEEPAEEESVEEESAEEESVEEEAAEEAEEAAE